MTNEEAFDINQPFVTQEQKFKYWEESKAEIKRLKAAIAYMQEQSEPVAWIETDCIGERYLCFSKPNSSNQIIPLYTTPQRQQPLKRLSDEKIIEIWESKRWGMEMDQS